MKLCGARQIWATGDTAKAGEIMTHDVHLYNLIYGSKQQGVESFTGMIHGVFKVGAPHALARAAP